MEKIKAAVYSSQMIKRAMKKVGYGDGINDVLDVLDEMELDRKLAIAIEQADRGEGRPVDEFIQELNEEFANGYYTQENARKRIESGNENERKHNRT